MSNLQKYFEEFHEAIKLNSENEELRTSRDAIKSKLVSTLKDYYKDKGLPTPTFFDQGSYAMGTGVKPHDNETYYDIDEGVKFEILSSDHPDPVEIKKSIKEALSGHTELGVEIKEPCVRIIYSENGKQKYHVDLAIYATNGQEQRGAVLQLGRGKEFSDSENKRWESSQPEALIDLVDKKFSDEEKAQFHRIIRYLKRWKDLHFYSYGNSSPRGIALTVAAYYFFIPNFDPSSGVPDDLTALTTLISTVLNSTQQVYENGEYYYRFICQLPVEPSIDLFGKMTKLQMQQFVKKFGTLKQVLENAKLEITEEDACLVLAEVFGDDFPSAELAKAFYTVTKPNIGYHPVLPVITNYETAPYDVPVRGLLFTKKGRIPFVPNKRVLGPHHKLEFHAEIALNPEHEIYWRVVNTGNHCVELAKTKSEEEIFRGTLQKAHLVAKNGEAVESSDPRITQESTLYTGKHWIECIVVKDNICIAKSKQFLVNIYNPIFIRYF